VETGLRFVPARGQSLDLRYTALRGVNDTIPVGLTKYTFNYPAQSTVVSWQVLRRDGLMLRTRLGILDRRDRDPYQLWDVYMAYSRGKVHPFLQVSNLTSTTYQEILGVAMPGRSIIGGVELVLTRSKSY
jgi:iron complex outermembrane receptor protein